MGDSTKLRSLVGMIKAVYGLNTRAIASVLQIRRVSVRLDTTEVNTPARVCYALSCLLGCAVWAEAVELEVDEAVLPIWDDEVVDAGTLERMPDWQDILATALAKLAKLKSFTLLGFGPSSRRPWLPIDLVAK